MKFMILALCAMLLFTCLASDLAQAYPNSTGYYVNGNTAYAFSTQYGPPQLIIATKYVKTGSEWVEVSTYIIWWSAYFPAGENTFIQWPGNDTITTIEPPTTDPSVPAAGMLIDDVYYTHSATLP